MTTCTALYCTSRVSKKIEGISFHKYPKDPKRLEEWLAAVGRREDWRPRHHSTLCSLHFEEDAFDRNSSMKVYLKRDAVPTIFPVAKRKPYKNSKKQPRDPAILHEEGDPWPKRPPAKRARNVTPIAVEKFTKLKPWSEDDEAQITKKSEKKGPATLRSARLLEPLVILQEGSNLNRPKSKVTKEAENQPRECPISPQEPCSGVESISIGEVRSIKESEEQPQDNEEFALRNAIDGLSSNEPKAPARSKGSKSVLERPKKRKPLVSSTNSFTAVPSTITSVQPATQPVSSAIHVAGRHFHYARLVTAPTTSTVSTSGRKETTVIPVSNTSPLVTGVATPSSLPSSTTESQVHPTVPTAPAELKAPRTADGATNSVMMVNLVCPHCQKACKVCLNIKPPQPLSNVALTNLRSDNKKKVRKLMSQVQASLSAQVKLERGKQSMLKKVKALNQIIRRLKAKNEQLQKALETQESSKRKTHVKKEEDLMVIGTINEKNIDVVKQERNL